MPTTTALRRTPSATALTALVATVLLAATSAPARADGPTLDPSFGSAGISLQARPHPATIYALLPLPGGGFLAAGQESTVGFLVARYLPDGTLDPSFGSGGVATIPGNLQHCSDDASSGTMSLLSTAAGTVAGILCGGRNGTLARAGVARFTAAGVLDPSFGTGGVSTYPASPAVATFGAGLAQTSGGALVTALQNGFGGSPNTISALRWTAGGALDPAFGSGGVGPTFTFATSSDAGAVAVDGSDRVLIAGSDTTMSPTNGFGVMRLTATGALDPLWTGGTPVMLKVGDGTTIPLTVAVQADGKILVAGAAQQSGVAVLAVLRLIPPPEPTPPVAPPVAPPVSPPVTPPVAKKPAFTSVVKLPSARRCLSRRSFRIRLRAPKGVKLRSVTVTVSGHKVKTVKGKRLRAPVDLRGLPKGRYTVRITVRLGNGTVLRGSRTYRTCAPRHRAHHRGHHTRSL